MRLGTAPPLRARLLAPQIYRREPDPKARGDHRRRQTGRISQQHPLAQISRIGAWHHCLLQETNHSTHKQHTFQIHTESALMIAIDLPPLGNPSGIGCAGCAGSNCTPLCNAFNGGQKWADAGGRSAFLILRMSFHEIQRSGRDGPNTWPVIAGLSGVSCDRRRNQASPIMARRRPRRGNGNRVCVRSVQAAGASGASYE